MASVTQIIRRRRRRRIRHLEARSRNRFWVAAIGLFVILAVIGPLGVMFGGVATAYARALRVLPDPQDTINIESVIRPTSIYDSLGQTLLFSVQDPLGDRRTWITLDELPDYVWQATVFWEDPDFLETSGFNLISTVEKLWTNSISGPVSPDPTLTGRLVRNVISSPQDSATVDNRALEIALVAEINRLYSPQEILEWHLNTNYYGNEAYGIEAAAQVYLGKSARDLTLDEAALLAAIPTAPQINPVDNETAARGRQGDLLRRMLSDGHITQSQFQEAINVQTPVRPDAGQTPLVAPEFASYARRQAETILTSLGMDGPAMVARGGLRITTTLDIDLYYQAECALRAHLARLAGTLDPQVEAQDGTQCISMGYLPPVDAAAPSPPDTGSIVILDAATGEVRAMVGSTTSYTHQPGPVLHPFVYLDGFLSDEYNAASMLLDIRRSFPGAADGLLYIPNNPDGQFRGPVSLRQAMGAGLLPPVVQVANDLNLNSVLRRTAHTLGINSLRDGIYDLSLLAEGGAVSVLDVAYAYSVFAAMGDVNGVPVEPRAPGLRNHDPVVVKRIEDPEGNVLWNYDDEQIALSRAPLLQEEVAYLVNHILSDHATRWPTLNQNNILELPFRAAVVNGITSDQIDDWTVGYTPHVVVGVHLGREGDGAMTLEPFAIDGAAPVWRAVIGYIYDRDRLAAGEWPRPDTIIETTVCEISGMAPNGACPTRREIFLHAGQVPPEDTHWEIVEVNSATGQRATANTPDDLVVANRYFIPPMGEAMDWWTANNRPLPPTQWDRESRPEILSGSTVILQPDDYDYVGGVVDVRGSIDASNMRFYQLSYGQGLTPSSWTDLTGSQESYVAGASLGTWDTNGLNGTYALRLTVALEDGTRETDVVPVIVDNLAPTIVLTTGETGQTVFRWPEEQEIQLVAEVVDNISIERVEFYHNGQYVGTDTDADTDPPFGYKYEINRAGIENFSAVAFDAVGNRSEEAQIRVEVVRSGG